MVFACLWTGPATGTERKGSASITGSVIGFYQKYISDLRYGRCRFDPSCSHYAVQSFENAGLFKGAALSADRLIRCNAAAPAYHARGTDGRLVDPAGDEIPLRSRPEIPPWLLPVRMDPPFPVDALEIQHLDMESTRRRTVAELIDMADFADALALSGDCWRAETEYRRCAFLARNSDVGRWASIKAGGCYYAHRQWGESATRFLEAVDTASDADQEAEPRLLAAAAYFNAADYQRCETTLQLCRPESSELSASVNVVHGLCAMVAGQWRSGAAHFERAANDFPDSPNRNQMDFFKWKAEEGRTAVPRKHANLAATLSIVPGMGQMYTGRYYDGFRHLVVDGLLIVTVYQLFRNEYYGAGYLLAGFTLPFYAGNIIGARRSAESFNASRRAEYVTGVIDEASAQ